MQSILAPLNLEFEHAMWKQPSSPTLKSSLVRLPSLFPMPGSVTRVSTTHSTVVISDAFSPLKEKKIGRLPSIGAMINRDKQHQDIKTILLCQPELKLNSLLVDVAVCQLAEQQTSSLLPALNHFLNSDKEKRINSAKLCGVVECYKRAKAGGFCIAHGGGLRCSEVNCTKHAVSLGLCISHGGGKRCTVDGCLNASRKNGVCWSHGGKRLCKLEGCNKGPKTGGYCWSHGGKMKK